MSTVTWRQAVAAMLATVLVLAALVVVVRSDGLPAVDATSSRAVRWFVHQPTGRLVLADGFGGRALASLEVGSPGDDLIVAEGPSGAYLINDDTAEVRSIDSAELRLGSPQGLAPLGAGRAIAGVAPAGLVVVDPIERSASLLPGSGESIPFTAEMGRSALVAPDGSIWSVVGDRIVRTAPGSAAAAAARPLGAASGELSLVGNRPFVLDAAGRRARYDDGPWVELPTTAAPSQIIVQEQGPPNRCGWVGAGDNLWCVSADGIEERSTVENLGIDGPDRLAIAGDSAALVRRGPTAIARFDWRDGELLTDQVASVASDASVDVNATVDLIWVNDRRGNFVWAIHPWGITRINKNDNSVLVLGEEGEVLDEGDRPDGGSGGADDGSSGGIEVREPDDNGFDDPPVAVDDPVTARSGSPVLVPVTANDYDPDGEAIVVVGADRPGHGTVEIGTATTLTYNPEPGFVGIDTFGYTIADGNGTEAEANVVVELLPSDASNRPPIGSLDTAQTGPGIAVDVEVLLNDIDPERDSLRIGSFSQPEGGGEVTEIGGLSGLPALRFTPIEGFEGTAIFSYRPVDSFEASGEEVEVRVEVASAADANRPPVVQPDAVRIRRNVVTPLPVLVNDIDPDGDVMTLSLVEPLPAGLEVDVEGDQLSITARAGSASLVPFEYEVDDGRGHRVGGAVLVAVIDDVEPNRPPVVSPDFATAVVGQTVTLDVTANDTDPDGDPLVIVEVTQPDEGRGDVAIVGLDRIEFTPATIVDEESANARFTYTVNDGNGHEVAGDVTITVLPEPLPEPPYAQDDSTFTFVDEPVTIDVLRNDGDPSGERPTIVGTPGCPAGGRAIVTADDQVRFDPPAGESGAFRCSYEVTNSQSLRASASIIVSVREPDITNEPPETANDVLNVEVRETATIDVAENDDDPDGPNIDLVVVSSTAPSFGSAVRDGNEITFTAGNQTGVAQINYQIADAEGAVSLGRLTIIIGEQENQPPNASNDVRTIEGPGVPTSIDVLSNDFDPDDTPGGLTVLRAALLDGDGGLTRTGEVVTISPNPDFVGTLIAEYTIADGEGLTDTGQISLNVLEPVNRPPVASDDSAEVASGSSVTVSVLFNDSDPDGDTLTMSILGGPDASLGTVSVVGDRSIAFAATPGASGTATISYEVSDGELTDTGTLRVAVLACSESTPTAGDVFLTTGYQQPIAADPADFSSNGTVVDVVAPPGYSNGTYTPPAGENGNVSITFAVVNSCRQRATGSIVIDVNQAPAAQPVAIAMGRNEVREIPVSNLASDAETLKIVGSNGTPGWVTVESGRVLIDSTSAATGVSSFTVTVQDPGGLSANVPVTVTVDNAPPVAAPDAADASGGASTVVDVLDNDIDPDGENSALRVQSSPTSLTFSNGESGIVQVLGNGRTLRIDPLDGTGTATFTYTAVDADGGVSAPAMVTVTGPAANSAPFANDQNATVATGALTAIVLDAGDVDGNALTVTVLTDPSSVVVDVTDLTLRVLVPTDGTVSLTYQVSDGVEQSPVATVTITAATATTTTTTVPPATTTTTVPPATTTDHVPPATTTTTVPPATTTTTAPPATTTTTEPPPPPPTTDPTAAAADHRPRPPARGLTRCVTDGAWHHL